jgi:hypothetical protein
MNMTAVLAVAEEVTGKGPGHLVIGDANCVPPDILLRYQCPGLHSVRHGGASVKKSDVFRPAWRNDLSGTAAD